MSESRTRWQNTTHDWASSVDGEHLAQIRRRPTEFAPGGSLYLILEVIAYPVDEAESTADGCCVVTLHVDGSVSVTDNGRGTDTRYDDSGQPIKKPVMATRDLRFFDFPDAQLLSDGHPRRGMSVVAALSDWLVHANRRSNGARTQRYENGVPVTDLIQIHADGTTGTTVHFLPNDAMRGPLAVEAAQMRQLAVFPNLKVEIITETSVAFSRSCFVPRTFQSLSDGMPHPRSRELPLGVRHEVPPAGREGCADDF
ncbi:ATP-binding protein [Arthrobacter terrae]|uniref:ATP-binding protein n=1 Tax=Arthrobacter terrae TaxID=2935737 RepID=UPI001E3F6979|nr:ATP-binding protein [Arthrobacter terrae]